MVCGAVGTISVTANIAPKLMKEFNDAALNNDWVKAREIHYKLLPTHKAMFVETNPLPVKSALAQKNLIKNYLRSPLCESSLETDKLVKEIITELGVEF